MVQVLLSRLCESAGIGAFCSPAALDDAHAKQLSTLSSHVMRIERGAICWQPGDAGDILIRIRTGALKSTQDGARSPACITGLWFAGDVVGLDAFYAGSRTNTVTALVPAEVECIPVNRLVEGSLWEPALISALMGLMSRELLRREQQLLVTRASSEQRVALFLAALSLRTRNLETRKGLDLCMTRQEIADFLGLRMETVTRRLRDLHYGDVVKLHGRRVVVCNPQALAAQAGLVADRSPAATTSSKTVAS